MPPRDPVTHQKSHTQFLGTLTGHGVSRVNYEVSRLSKLREDARRCSKDLQQVWYELEMFNVCRDDMPCEVKRNPNMGFFWWGLMASIFYCVTKSGKIHRVNTQ